MIIKSLIKCKRDQLKCMTNQTFYYDIKIERKWVESTGSKHKVNRPFNVITLSAKATKLILF